MDEHATCHSLERADHNQQQATSLRSSTNVQCTSITQHTWGLTRPQECQDLVSSSHWDLLPFLQSVPQQSGCIKQHLVTGLQLLGNKKRHTPGSQDPVAHLRV